MSVFFLPEQAPLNKKLAPKHRWLRRLAVVVAAMAVLGLVTSAIYVGSVSRSFTDHVSRKDLLPPSTSETDRSLSPTSGGDDSARPADGRQEAVNYVLMGSDSRTAADAGAGRSDTLMVVHLAANRKSVSLISFPRDMYVAIPGHGRNKINAAFAFGGPQLTVRTLEQLLDTRMDHVALVDFDGFIRLTQALGGVTVVNKHDSSSRGYDFPAGEITVEGDEALAYVRERYDLPNGDLDRAERQRDVVGAVLQKGLSLDKVAHPVKFTNFVSGVADHLTVDSRLSNSEMRSTALSLRLTGKDVASLQAPISGFATVDGQSIDVVDNKQMKRLSEALKNDRMDLYPGK